MTVTSTAPSGVVVGGASYTPTATASSGLAVAITLDGSSTGCALSGGVVSFTAVGTCVIDFNQAGNGSYSAAPQKQQSIAVAAASGGFPTGWHKLVISTDSLCLDSAGNTSTAGAVIDQWTCNGQSNQQFQFVATSGGYGELAVQKSGQDVTVLNSATAQGVTDIVQEPVNGNAASQWLPRRAVRWLLRVPEQEQRAVPGRLRAPAPTWASNWTSGPARTLPAATRTSSRSDECWRRLAERAGDAGWDTASARAHEARNPQPDVGQRHRAGGAVRRDLDAHPVRVSAVGLEPAPRPGRGGRRARGVRAGAVAKAATDVALVFPNSGVAPAAENVSHMADLPGWVARWSEQQSRVADAVASVAPFDRLPRTWLIRLLQSVALFGLLALGVLAGSTFAWALIAIPMTMIVALVLSGGQRMPRTSLTAQQRPGPFDVQAMGPSVLEPSFDSPIVVARRPQTSPPQPLVVRRTR